MSLQTKRRVTKYTVAVEAFFEKNGHGSNAEVIAAVRQFYPETSETTIHRVTTRLHEDGLLSEAPKMLDGATRYDVRTDPHDHFMCHRCGKVKDISLPLSFRALLRHMLGDCDVNGPLTVSGACEHCTNS